MVELITSAKEMLHQMQEWRASGRTTGFVPTMGALHEGHLSLVKRAKAENDVTIVSIFVNPTQFNDASDLEKYPRTLKKDLTLLAECGNVIAFAPDVSDVYPDGMQIARRFELGQLETGMEGAQRPGHFQGVVQVVKRLLDLVPATRLYMGQKDFQQFTIIRYMLSQWQLPVSLIICPIVREENGLAMSSRNERLSPGARKKAGIIYQVLTSLKKNAAASQWQNALLIHQQMFQENGVDLEYLEIVDAESLMPPDPIKGCRCAVACVAVQIEGVRLIDNIVLWGNLP